MNRRTSTDRNTRSEPFEVFTRPQRSVPARLVGLLIRCRAEITATSPPARQAGGHQPRPAARPALHVVPGQKGA